MLLLEVVLFHVCKEHYEYVLWLGCTYDLLHIFFEVIGILSCTSGATFSTNATLSRNTEGAIAKLSWQTRGNVASVGLGMCTSEDGFFAIDTNVLARIKLATYDNDDDNVLTIDRYTLAWIQ